MKEWILLFFLLFFSILPNAYALNLKKSSSAHYLISWCEEKIAQLENNIADIKKEGDEQKLSHWKSRLEELKRKTNICQRENLSRGKIEISKEFLKEFSEITNTDISEQDLNKILEMIQREAFYADNYFVIYTANDIETEDRYIRICLKHLKDGINDIDQCLGAKVIRSKDDLSFKSLDEIFEKHIYNDSFVDDHSSEMKNHFISANLSLFGNHGTAESTLNRFLKRGTPYKISSEAYDILREIIYNENMGVSQGMHKFFKKLKALSRQETGILRQIFINKKIANEVGYISSAYGFPFYNEISLVKRDTFETLKSFQKGKYQAKELNYNFVIPLKGMQHIGYMSATENSRLNTRAYFQQTTPQYKNYQFRLMYLPKYFLKNDNILIFDSYSPSPTSVLAKENLLFVTCPELDKIIQNPSYNKKQFFYMDDDFTQLRVYVNNPLWDYQKKIRLSAVSVNEKLGEPSIECKYDYVPPVPFHELYATIRSEDLKELANIHICEGPASLREPTNIKSANTYVPSNKDKKITITCSDLGLTPDPIKSNFLEFNKDFVPEDCKDRKCDKNELLRAFINNQKESAKQNNDKIPKKSYDSIRIATFNAGTWPHSKIMEIIGGLNVDIVAIQEVLRDEEVTFPQNSLFKHFKYCEAEGLANVIFSKYEIKEAKTYQTSKFRCAVAATINTRLGEIELIGTHLDVFDDTGKTRQKEIKLIAKESISQWKSNNSKGLIMLGDMNSLKKDEINGNRWNSILAADHLRGVSTASEEIPLIESFGMLDSFSILKTPPPISTVWSGRRVDYIFSHSNSQLVPKGCYVYHSTISDHVPLICDFEIKK